MYQLTHGPVLVCGPGVGTTGLGHKVSPLNLRVLRCHQILIYRKSWRTWTRRPQ